TLTAWRLSAAWRLGAARIEEVRELRIGDLVAIDPDVGDVHAMQRCLVRRAVVASHPERAGLNQHDAIGVSERRRQQHADERHEADGAAAHTAGRALHARIVWMHRRADAAL